MIEFLLQPWPWWLSGIMIGLTLPLLYLVSGKAFGISSSLQHIGAACTPNTPIDYLRNHNWHDGIWNLVFVGGIIVGSFFAVNFFSSSPIEFLPADYYSLGGAMRLLFGGVLVGFGTRYAGGCTSGHAITGIANLNWPSLVASAFFFIGGLAVTWGLGTLLF
jgi:uncharacterized membrane protein YedE/YeeE